MRTDSLFQLCFYFCICMLLFNLSVSFVSAANFFDTSVNTGSELGDKGDDITKNASSGQSLVYGNDKVTSSGGYNFNDIWKILISGVALGAIVILYLSRDIRVLGVYAFGVFFWASYLNMLGIINFSQWFPGFGFEAIIHGAMVFVFIGAIIGITSGSG